MTTTLCTLYNSLYLDKGLVLYDSLCECTKNFKLYVLCMDDKCYEVLTSLKQQNHFPIRLSEVEEYNKELLEAKQNRPFSEYCWTCTSALLLFILKNYEEPICTYVDADMYFYHDPQVLIDEMLDARKSVMMVPHRFTENNIHLSEKVGTYCIEFNTFRNDVNGLKVLNHWHSKCLECCSNLGDGIHWGDQKYMDEWPDLFPEIVHICQNVGAGIAPWNIEAYRDYDDNNGSIRYESGCTSSIVFFHYASLTYRSRRLIDTGIVCTSNLNYKLVESLYQSYLLKIDKKKENIYLNYGIDTLIKKHPSAIGQLTLRQCITSSYLGVFIRSLFPRMNEGHSYIVRL